MAQFSHQLVPLYTISLGDIGYNFVTIEYHAKWDKDKRNITVGNKWVPKSPAVIVTHSKL